MAKAVRLLRQAALIYDAPDGQLRQAAKRAHDFDTGAEWMRAALEKLRHRRLPPMPTGFHAAGIVKYAIASFCAIAAVAAAYWHGHWWWVALAVPAFYAAEVQGVFLFPLMLDAHPRPVQHGIYLTQRTGGTLKAMSVVMPLACLMLFGGFFGGGFRRSWCLGCLAICIWYEEVRHRLPHIRRESFSKLGLRSSVRVMFASDIHLGLPWTQRAGVELLRAARHEKPDLVLLGGDLLDSARALGVLRRILTLLNARFPVFVVPGNHDRRFGELRALVQEVGAEWLPDRPATYRSPNGETVEVSTQAGGENGRPHIQCRHDPATFLAKRSSLAFAGHLHGGQCVIGSFKGRLFPGYLFNRWTVLRMMTAEGTVLVSRGLADFLPIRFRCPYEVILCEVR